jgi:hypothetical protein
MLFAFVNLIWERKGKRIHIIVQHFKKNSWPKVANILPIPSFFEKIEEKEDRSRFTFRHSNLLKQIALLHY